MKKILNYAIFIILIALFGLLAFQVIKLNVLPAKYLYLLLGGLVLILGTISFFFIKQEKDSLVRILVIFEVLFIIISGYFNYYVYRTNSFIDNIEKVSVQTIDYYVMTSSKSNFKTVRELADRQIGVLNLGEEYDVEAIAKFDATLGYNKVEYTELEKVANDLLNGTVEAIFINSIYKDVLDEDMEGFEEGSKVLYTVSVEEKVEDIVKITESAKPFNLYISGIDTAGNINKTSRSDVNIILTVNPGTNEILLTSIPRDYYVKLHGKSGKNDKLAHAGNYGINMSIETIEDLMGIDINYYLRVNFSTVTAVVDAIDGIDVYSDATFSEYGYKFKEGMNSLNGKQALMFCRIRHVLKGGDRARGRHQEAVIEAIVKKISSSKTLLTSYEDLLASLSDKFQTNMETDTIKELVKYQIDKMPVWEFKSISLDGSCASRTTYSSPSKARSVMIPNNDTIINAQNYISGVLNNKTFESIEGNK